MSTISALIITRNEEKNIEDCIKTVEWANEIVIVDSNSSDRTIEIARRYTNKIYKNEFRDFASQKNLCLSHASCDWVLFIDADERITETLRLCIKDIINDSRGMDGYYIKRLTYIFGRLMQKGGHNKDYQLRLFKRIGSCFLQPVHERVQCAGSRIGYIDKPMLHYSTRNLSEYVNKMNFYTDLEARFIVEKGKRITLKKMITFPILRFFQKYILQQGFKDGFEGFLFYVLSSFCDFIKYSKCRELAHSNGHK